MRKLLWFFTTFAFLLSLTACASKPAQELTDAQSTLDQVKSAEAEVYAGAQYQTAADTLKSAETEIAAQDEKSALGRNYDKAKELLATAKEQAEAAGSAAEAKKKEVKVECEAAQTAAQQSLEADKALLGKATRADLNPLKENLTAAESSFQEAQQALQAGKYMDALTRFNALKNRADDIRSESQAVMAKRKKG